MCLLNCGVDCECAAGAGHLARVVADGVHAALARAAPAVGGVLDVGSVAGALYEGEVVALYALLHELVCLAVVDARLRHEVAEVAEGEALRAALDEVLHRAGVDQDVGDEDAGRVGGFADVYDGAVRGDLLDGHAVRVVAEELVAHDERLALEGLDGGAVEELQRGAVDLVAAELLKPHRAVEVDLAAEVVEHARLADGVRPEPPEACIFDFLHPTICRTVNINAKPSGVHGLFFPRTARFPLR